VVVVIKIKHEKLHKISITDIHHAQFIEVFREH